METILFGIVGVLLLLVVLALLIPFLLIGIAAGLIGAAVLGVKRLLSGSRAPNGHIGPVRTDGRSNVRVIDRDGR